MPHGPRGGAVQSGHEGEDLPAPGQGDPRGAHVTARGQRGAGDRQAQQDLRPHRWVKALF